MFTLHIDLGQVLLGGMIGIVGYFVKRMIDSFGSRLDKHENILFELSGQIQKVIGYSTGYNEANGFTSDRRKKPRI